MSETKKLLESIQSNLKEIDDSNRKTLGGDLNSNHAKYWGNQSCFDDIRDLDLKNKSDEEKISNLQNLLDNIENNITNRLDYNEASSDYIQYWIQGYKEVIDYYIKEIEKSNKYCINLFVDTGKNGDTDHKSSCIAISNGKISKGEKYYDSEEEANKDLNTLDNSMIEDFVKSNFVGEYDDLYDWEIRVDKYESDISKF